MTITETTISKIQLKHGYLVVGLVTAKHSNVSMTGLNIDANDATTPHPDMYETRNILQFETTILTSVDSCMFIRNNGLYKHMASLNSGSTGFINNSQFIENDGEHVPCAIHVDEGAVGSIRNSDFIVNGNNSNMCVIFSCTGGNVTVVNVKLTNNVANIMSMKFCKITVSSSHSEGNHFKPSYNTRSSLKIDNCSFTDTKSN